MAEYQLTRVEEDAPNRCQHTATQGQCILAAVPGSERCSAHGGMAAVRAAERAEVQDYDLAKYQARFGHFSSSPSIKSLRGEVALLRILIETRFQRAGLLDDDDHGMGLLAQSREISELVSKVGTLVVSCHKLEQSLGELLDKGTIVNIAAQLVVIASRYITDPEVLDQFANEIMEKVLGPGENDAS